MHPFTRVSKVFVDPPAGIDCDTPAGGYFCFCTIYRFPILIPDRRISHHAQYRHRGSPQPAVRV